MHTEFRNLSNYTLYMQNSENHIPNYILYIILYRRKKINREFRKATLYSVAQINDDPINTYRIQKATQRQKSLYNQLLKKKLLVQSKFRKSYTRNERRKKAIQV